MSDLRLLVDLIIESNQVIYIDKAKPLDTFVALVPSEKKDIFSVSPGFYYTILRP